MIDSYVTTSTPAVQIAAPVVDAIPASMKAERRWLTWRAVRRESGKLDKIPHDALDGWKGSATNEADWGTFDEALDTYRRCKLSGIGFALDEDAGWVVIDLDHCVDASGEIEPWARAIIATVDSYTEISPSGAGVHIFARGGLPRSGTRVGKVEMYTGGRFITVTGRHVAGTPTEAESRSEEVRDVYIEHCRDTAGAASNLHAARPSDDDMTFTDDEPPVRLEASDRAIWDGERNVHYPDGRLDRSETLWKIGEMLARNGCTRWVIAQAVAERDRTLGFEKYTDRRDDREYRRIAAGTWAFASGQSWVIGVTRGERRLKAELAAVREERDVWKKKLQEREEERSRVAAVLRNDKLRPQERIVVIAATNEYAYQREQGKADEEGRVKVYMPAIAEKAGCSPSTASRGLKAAESAGCLRRLVKPNQDNRNELYLQMDADPNAALAAAATAEPKRDCGQHGGDRRPRCEDHPHAHVVERTVRYCEDCGQTVGKATLRLYTDEEPDGFAVTEDGSGEPIRHQDGNACRYSRVQLARGYPRAFLVFGARAAGESTVQEDF